MKTTIQEQDGKMIAILEGNLDTPAAQETAKIMSPLYSCKGYDVVIDCTGLTYISSSGLRIFLNVLKNADSNGKRVYVKGISDGIRAVFAMTGFINLFEYI